MHTTGKIAGMQKTMDGTVQIIFEFDADDIDKLTELKDDRLAIDIDKWHPKRSQEANRYLWKMCELIAKAIGSDKDTVYLSKLKEYGVFEDWQIPVDAVPKFSKIWRMTEIQYRYHSRSEFGVITMAYTRCWKGSHEYDTKQMSELLNGIKSDAEDLGIDTWSDEEIEHALSMWKGA